MTFIIYPNHCKIFETVTVKWMPCCAYSPVNNRSKARDESAWRKPKTISCNDYKNRYCSYLITRRSEHRRNDEREKSQLKRYFAVAFCFSSNLIFKKLRNNREEETLSSFNWENTQLTKLRWMEHCFEDDDDDDGRREREGEKKQLKVFFPLFHLFLNAPLQFYLLLKSAFHCFHIWTQFICFVIWALCLLAKFCISRLLKPL